MDDRQPRLNRCAEMGIPWLFAPLHPRSSPKSIYKLTRHSTSHAQTAITSWRSKLSCGDVSLTNGCPPAVFGSHESWTTKFRGVEGGLDSLQKTFHVAEVRLHGE
jgi:hypothetical protein